MSHIFEAITHRDNSLGGNWTPVESEATTPRKAAQDFAASDKDLVASDKLAWDGETLKLLLRCVGTPAPTCACPPPGVIAESQVSEHEAAIAACPVHGQGPPRPPEAPEAEGQDNLVPGRMWTVTVRRKTVYSVDTCRAVQI